MYHGHQVIAMAMVRLVRLAGSTVAKASASSSGGNARKMSVIRMMISSVTPPKYPASTPSGMPTTHEISSTNRATTGDTRAPVSTRENTSRPTWSVPNRCCADGACSAISGWVAAPASAGYGATSGAKTATSTISSAITPPVAISGLARRNRPNLLIPIPVIGA